MDKEFYNDIDNDTENEEERIEIIDAIINDDDDDNENENGLKDLLLNSDLDDLNEAIESVFAIDIALALEEFNDEEILQFTQKIDDEHMAQIIEQADEDLQVHIVSLLGYTKTLSILNHMSKDDIADILGNLPINFRKDILKLMKSTDTIEIQSLLLYDEDTAGGIMTTEYIALRSSLKAIDALQKIKEIGPKTEVIETIFVLNNRKELVGTADLRDIFVADNDVTLKDIMDDNIITVTPDIDQEEVSHLVSKYDLKAIPVTNKRGSLLGIITVDDIIDVLLEEQTEDILRLGGVNGEESVYSSIFDSVKVRLPWLILNLFTAFTASFIISIFESTTAQVVALAATMPIITGMGGNAGTQTLSIVIRGITLGEIDLKEDWLKVFKEITVALINSSVTGSLAALFIFFKYENIYLSAIVIAAMMMNYVVAAFFGFFIPLVFKALKLDPALSSGIFLTTATDTLGFFIFLSLATLILPLLV